MADHTPLRRRRTETPKQRMRRLEDVQLLKEYRRGREPAFDELVRRHGGAIKSYALRMLRNPEQAEEVYEDTFLRVATATGAWESLGTVRGYLFTIAHRLCVDILRKRKVERAALPGLVELARARRVGPSPEAQVAMGQRAEQLEIAIAALPEDHRQVLLMRTVHGLSAAETGEALGMTPNQVHSQLSYARKRLRQELSQGNDERRVRRRSS